jgi:hypothetical protein
MSNQLISSEKQLFTPRDLVSTPVEGKSFLKLYPKRNIGDPWSELENNLAFNVNCSTLQNSNLKKNVIIETLAEQMGTSTQVHIYLQQYDSLGKNQFFDPGNLSILSYHNKKGAVIDDATHYVGGTETLKPINERPQGIHFVKFKCDLDFSSLGVSPSTSSAIQFYSTLPITTNVITEVEGTDYPSEEQIEALTEIVTTAEAFHQQSIDNENQQRTIDARLNAVTLARNDLNSNRQARATALARIESRLNGVNFNANPTWLSSQASATTLKAFLHGTAIGSTNMAPFLLSKPAFDSNIASTNEKDFKAKFNALVMDVAFEPLKKVIFDYVCPNLKNEPFQLFKSVCQESPDPEKPGKTIKISVQQYVDIFNGLMRSLPSEAEWLVDVHEFFIRNLSTELREKMESDGYSTHLQSNSKKPFHQIQLIEEARRKALAAEKTLNSQVKMIQDQLSNAHGFFTTATGEQVLFSPAERTMKHYKDQQSDAKGPPKRPGYYNVSCWGCGSPDHRWYDRTLDKVVCPNSKNPVFIKAAAVAREKLKQARIARMKEQKKNNKNRSLLEALLAGKAEITFNSNDTASLTGESTSTISNGSSTSLKPGITFNVNSNSAKDEGKESPKKKVKFGDKVFNFITSAILHSANGKIPLPISIHNELPHIKIQLGEPDSDFNPALLGVIDTGATLTVGYHKYILGICEAYPQLVKSIIWAKDKYIPIELSGVVDSPNSNRPQSPSDNQLSAVVTFHMPYLTANNHSTSFSVAIGKNVAVNVLIGMSFIRNTEMTIDTSDNVAEARMLQCKPFEIIYKTAGRSAPNAIPTEFLPDQAVLTANSDTLKLVRDTFSYLDGRTQDEEHDEALPLSEAISKADDYKTNTIISSTSLTTSGTPEVTVKQPQSPVKSGKKVTYSF